MKKRDKVADSVTRSGSKSAAPQRLRIIGGKWRGRQIRYSGDPLTRPMKDNIREAVFNLIGGWIPGKTAIDLFAGTGAIGLEALSRGAEQAIFVERHFPTARIIEQNIADLDANNLSTVVTSDTFFWARDFLKQASVSARPWAVFCSPPYDLYRTKPEAMLELIDSLLRASPEGSVFVVESDARFDSRSLPQFVKWRVREYPPATIHVWRPADTGPVS
jgi:16S rRNA (guanine966-N2)-methyltransferase